MTVTETASEDTSPSPPTGALEGMPSAGEDPLVEEDLLIEEISIDGMCGVY
jgi:mycofactocin precursor